MGMRLCWCRNTRAVSRNAEGTSTNSHDLCILTDCDEYARNDVLGEQATRTLNIFVEWAIERGHTSSVMSRARPVDRQTPTCQTAGH